VIDFYDSSLYNPRVTVEAVTLSRALQLIKEGGISDGKSIIGILYAAGFRVAL